MSRFKPSSTVVANCKDHFPQVPDVHWDLSSKRILTMSFAEGGQVNDQDYMRMHGINVNEVEDGVQHSPSSDGPVNAAHTHTHTLRQHLKTSGMVRQPPGFQSCKEGSDACSSSHLPPAGVTGDPSDYSRLLQITCLSYQIYTT